MVVLTWKNVVKVLCEVAYPAKITDDGWTECPDSEKQGIFTTEAGFTCIYPRHYIINDVENVPAEVKPEKYVYIDGAFSENPDYVEPTAEGVSFDEIENAYKEGVNSI